MWNDVGREYETLDQMISAVAERRAAEHGTSVESEKGALKMNVKWLIPGDPLLKKSRALGGYIIQGVGHALLCKGQA